MKKKTLKMIRKAATIILAAFICFQIAAAGMPGNVKDVAAATITETTTESNDRVSEVQAMIDALPDVSELPAMDNEEQLSVYMDACDIADIYYDELSENQQSALDTENWVAILEWFANPDPLYVIDGNPNGTLTIDQALGCNYPIESWLNQHTNDKYYLGTPYQHASGSHNVEGMTKSPNGDVVSGYSAGMNCTGFVAHVLEKCGANLNPLRAATNNYNGHYVATNLSGWIRWLEDNNVLSYRYDSISALLASGKLQKGDIILFEPRNWSGKDTYGNSKDNHIGIFWGTSSSENKWWHSTHPVSGMGGENLIDGNQISAIIPKCADCYVYLLPVQHHKPIYSTTCYTARDAISPSLDIHIEKSDADTMEKLKGAEFAIYMDGKKVSTVTTDDNGHASYHWRGSTLYTAYQTSTTKKFCVNYDTLSADDKKTVNNNSSIYNDRSSAYSAAKTEAINKVSQALTDLTLNTMHTWKVIETKSPEGYELNTEVWEQTLNIGVTVIEINFTDVSNGGYLKLAKTSVNDNLTFGNGCYSLEGAEYGVYETEEDALNDENRVETLTTDADGNTEAVQLPAGEYFVKEVTASPGYGLCNGTDGAENGIHMVEVTADNTEDNPAMIECKEPPLNDPFRLQLFKVDADTMKNESQGIASLEGAIFAVDYYDNTNGDTSGKAYNTWYFKTDEYGRLSCSSQNYFVSKYEKENESVLISDDLYKDTLTGQIIYPLGTYTIKEIQAPLYYQLSGTMQFKENPSSNADVTQGLTLIINETDDKAQIVDGNNFIFAENELNVDVIEDIYKGSINIIKLDDNGKTPLQGVEFQLVGDDGSVYTGSTDKDGKLLFDSLIPQHYVLTETSTVPGHSLMKDSVDITIPVEMTLEEINASGADVTKAVWDEAAKSYCFYDVSYTITNTPTFSIPMTGGNQQVLYLVMVAAFILIAGGLLSFSLQKKRAH